MSGASGIKFSCGSSSALMSAVTNPLAATGLAPEDYVSTMKAALQGAQVRGWTGMGKDTGTLRGTVRCRIAEKGTSGQARDEGAASVYGVRIHWHTTSAHTGHDSEELRASGVSVATASPSAVCNFWSFRKGNSSRYGISAFKTVEVRRERHGATLPARPTFQLTHSPPPLRVACRRREHPRRQGQPRSSSDVSGSDSHGSPHGHTSVSYKFTVSPCNFTGV
jgi:hypothetical protein